MTTYVRTSTTRSTMLLVSTILQVFLVLLPLTAQQVSGHGYQSSPRSRNWYANEEGIEGSHPGVPSREYCPHCLNTNNGVCGASIDYDYDEWKDSQSNPMPWLSQATYASGDAINVASTLLAHHGGHMEIKGCPAGRASTPECFDDHVLTFVRDLLYDMPADPAYPERGYYYGGPGGQFKDFSMEFLLPDSLVGEQVLLQWRYITANSCSPPGYDDYFAGANSQSKVLPSKFWSEQVTECQLPYPQDGSRSGVHPEQFFNCAEVTILDPAPTVSRRPTSAPVTLSPVNQVVDPPTTPTSPTAPTAPTAPTTSTTPVGPACCSQNFKECITWCGSTQEECETSVCSSAEVFKWLPQGPLNGSCLPRWETCTDDQDSCCPGLVCSGDQYYRECETPDTTPDPTDTPPASSDLACCSQDFKGCIGWCGDSEDACGSCNPSESFAWLAAGPLDSCVARWGDCTSDSTGCCPGLECQYRGQYYSQCDSAP